MGGKADSAIGGMRPTDDIVIVMPCHNDYPSIRILLGNLERTGLPHRVVIVDDCSAEIDRSIVGDRVRIIRLNRNLGHQGAIAAGLSWLRANRIPFRHVVIMDSDGEDDPLSIPRLVEEMEKGAAPGRRGRRPWRVCMAIPDGDAPDSEKAPAGGSPD